MDAENVILSIRDFGKGIPEERLEQFRRTSSGVGVGLAGMRERVRHLNGNLDIESDREGTLVKVNIPLSGEGESSQRNAAPSQPDATAKANSSAASSSAAADHSLLLEGMAADIVKRSS